MKELYTLPYFSLGQATQLYSSKKVALVNISRGIKNNSIIKIREGYYVSEKFVNELKFSNNLNSYIEFLASNIIYIPSYISLESVLFENNIIAENVYNMTLITTKKTNSFSNNLGTFKYRNLKKDFFGDYEIINKNGFLIYKATKEKALFDYLYLKTDIIFDIRYFEELRLNIENISITKFEKLIKKYKSPKMNKIFICLKKLKGL